MGKILTLTAAQAQEIRSGILNSYLQENGAEFQPVTYLGAYEDLRAHILSKCTDVPGAEASISLHRLRKLFYYTDPNYCPNDKLEPLSFGDDFISLLTRFKSTSNSSENTSTKKTTFPGTNTRAHLMSSVFIILALSGFLAYQYVFRAPYFFRDDFHANSVEDLKSRGWDFIDFDSSLFYPQDTGVLTLRSSIGDYWVRAIDTPVIKNLVIHRLPSSCFEVTLSFSFQKTYENYQQCGIIFLDKDLQRIHNIRVSKGASPRSTPQTHSFLILKRNESEATHYSWTETDRLDYNCDNVFFKVIKSKDEYSFYFHCGYSSDGYKLAHIVKFEFEPKYLGLFAFNGLRDYTNGPLNTASSIPAKFDWVRVKECK